MPSALQPHPTYWRPLDVMAQPTEQDLQAMGFDVRRLGFYAWLVAHGREPNLDEDAPVSALRCGEALSR